MGNDLQSQARKYGLSYIDQVARSMYDSDLLANLPVAWVREQGVLPIRIEGAACLLVSRPDCLALLQHVQLATGVEFQPVLASPEVVAAAIDGAYYERPTASPSSGGAGVAPAAAPVRAAADRGTDLLAASEMAPVTQWVNNCLLDAVRRRASDVHFEPETGGIRVRFRVDGTLYEQPAPPSQFHEALISRVKVMAHMDIAERRLPQDGMTQVSVGERTIDVRVSTVPVVDGERVVMRLLDRSTALLPLSDLGMPEAIITPFRELLALPNGLVVVSGPTGSGKTTTLYSALGSLDAKRRNILTVEEPVEYRLPDIGQIQVRPKIGLTFASGLRHILRQDPDVVLVGETRDTETAEIAVRAALTGHLVFTTLHTNDAPSAVARLVDMEVEPYLLASCLRGVLAQRLVRRLCPACRTAATIADVPVAPVATSLVAELGLEALQVARGCEECLDGYSGRVGLFELMPCEGPIIEAIHRQEVDADSLRQVAQGTGIFQTLRLDAIAKLRTGETDLPEVATALAV